MLAAKRDLDLPRMLRKLDNYDLLVIDDLGYLGCYAVRLLRSHSLSGEPT